jgi:hypothetical protein
VPGNQKIRCGLTLRAYNLIVKLSSQLHEQANYFSLLMVNRWFGFRRDMLSALLFMGVSLLAVQLRGSVHVGLIGFALVYSFSLGFCFN